MFKRWLLDKILKLALVNIFVFLYGLVNVFVFADFDWLRISAWSVLGFAFLSFAYVYVDKYVGNG